MTNTFFTYILPITLITLLGFFVWFFFLGPKPIPDGVKQTVVTFARAQENSDFKTLKTIYGSRALIKTERIYPNNKPSENYEISALRAIRLAEKAKSQSQQFNRAVQYTETTYKWVRDKTKILASSTKINTNTGQKTPHLLILTESKKKKWFIVEEYNVEYMAN